MRVGPVPCSRSPFTPYHTSGEREMTMAWVEVFSKHVLEPSERKFVRVDLMGQGRKRNYLLAKCEGMMLTVNNVLTRSHTLMTLATARDPLEQDNT